MINLEKNNPSEDTIKTLKISLKEARDWYNDDNSKLKYIALRVFNKDELEALR